MLKFEEVETQSLNSNATDFVAGFAAGATAVGGGIAAGVALTAIAGHLLFGERLTWLMALGIALIIGGVLLVQAGAAPSATPAAS